MIEQCNCLKDRPLYEKYAFEPLKESGFRLYCAACGIQFDVGQLPEELNAIHVFRVQHRRNRHVSESVPDEQIL